MLAVRKNVSSCSKMRSLLIVIEHAGVEEFPGPLPAVKVVRHVTPMKSPSATNAPSVVAESVWIFFANLIYTSSSRFSRVMLIKVHGHHQTRKDSSLAHHFLTCSSIACLSKSYNLSNNVLSYSC